MIDVVYAAPNTPEPSERHVAVIAHRDALGEKGYFYDSTAGDHGGSGPFDWRLSEAINRATRFAADNKIKLVIVRAAAL